MNSLVGRIAARHLAALEPVVERSLIARVKGRHRLAAFIPDQFFKTYEQRLKTLLKQPTKDPIADVRSYIYDLKTLFRDFERDLIGLAPQAHDTIEHRVKVNLDMLDGLSKTYDGLDDAVDFPFNAVSVVDHVKRYIRIEVDGKLKKKISTLGKALQWQPVVDKAKVEALARRVAKKANAEQIAAILEENWNNETLRVRYEFLKVNADKPAAALLKFIKIEKDFEGWFTFIRDVLAANYADADGVSMYEVDGMKIVIADSTMAVADYDKYVKHINEAHHRLKAKKLSRAWYGRIYVECKDCGGVNPNTGGGTGGSYNIGQDYVKVFVRPGPYVTELVLHELGHRYWFKNLSPSQRQKFEWRVRTHKSPRPEGIVPSKIIDERELDLPRRRIDDIDGTIKARLELFRIRRVKTTYAKLLNEHEADLMKAGLDYTDVATVMVGVVPPEDSELKTLFQDARKAVFEVATYLSPQNIRKRLDDAVIALPDGTDYTKAFEAARDKFLDEALQLVDMGTASAYIYMDGSLKLHNDRERAKMSEVEKKRQQEWDEDDRQIFPVSSYGKSNIDEAFAEVFAYYCLDRKLTDDQAASFKDVLVNRDRMAAKVGARWLEQGQYRAPDVSV